jgi:hypothetical protein
MGRIRSIGRRKIKGHFIKATAWDKGRPDINTNRIDIARPARAWMISPAMTIDIIKINKEMSLVRASQLCRGESRRENLSGSKPLMLSYAFYDLFLYLFILDR